MRRRLGVKVRLINKETGEVKEQEVFMGDFPLLTETGTFIINGAERVIVSQLVRSPSVYFNTKVDKNGKKTYAATVIPNRGAWLELETDAKDIVYVRIDRTRKIPVTVLLRSLGFGTDAEILDLLGNDEYIRNTLIKTTRIRRRKLSLKFTSVFVRVNLRLSIMRRVYWWRVSLIQNVMIWPM